MKQVVQAARGGPVQVLDVPSPTIDPTQVLVRTVSSVVSPGTERAVTALARSSLLHKARARPDLVRQVLRRAREDGPASAARAVRARLGGDVALGYSAAGTVVEVGAMVSGIAPGQLVATGGAGFANHAELQAVPGLLCVPVPVGLPAGRAAFATVGSIALHGLRLAEVGPGAKVVVVGLGLVGQLAARIALAAGCDVVGVDVAELPLRAAERAGALALAEEGDATTDRIMTWSRGRGADAVLVCAATKTSELMGRVPARARDRASVVVVGDVGLDLDRTPFYEKELSIRFARSYGPGRYEQAYEDWAVDYPAGQVRWTEGRNMEAVCDLLASGRVGVDDLVTHVFPVAEAAAAYELIEQRTEPFLAIRFDYDSARDLPAVITLRPEVVPAAMPGPRRPRDGGVPGSVGQRRRDHGPFAPPEAMIPRSVGQRRRDHGPFAPPEAMIPRSVEDLSIGWIGAGAFSSAVLYPAMRTAGFTRFTAVASAGGLSARRFGERAGFEKVLPDGAAVATAPGLDVVVIATPHDSHAALTVAALTAGRDVWCEKPVALSLPELDAVAGAVADSGRVLSVGLNRRFSPAARIAREHLDTRSAPITLIYRVAAGSIAAGHWYADRRQGGRLLGEVCHFIDTCCYLSPSPVVDVAARAGRAGRRESLLCDDVTVILTHADGSTSVIIYSSARPRGVRKERIEALAGDVHLVLDDFREVLVGGSPVWRGAQDKGHDAAVAAFRDRILDPHPGSATDDRLVSSRLVLLAAGQLGQLGQSLRKPDRDPEATLNYGE